MISDELVEALNDQMKQEFQASAMYLGMGAFLREENWDGFARFCEDQSEEEREHGMKIYHFLDEVNKTIKVGSVDKPKKDYSTVIEVFEKALEQEQENTRAFNDIQEIARRNDDYQAQTMIQWFIDEQIEEENHIEDILIQIRRLGGDEKFLFAVDQELGAVIDDE